MEANSALFTAEDYTPFLKWRQEELMENGSDLFLSTSHKKLKLIPPCVYAQPIQSYLRNETNRFALNIPPEAPEWDLCSEINYERSLLGSIDIYKKLRGKYRMLIFSGDTDGAVPTFGTQRWIQELNWEIEEPWRPYYVNK